MATRLDHALLVQVVACHRAMPPNLGATRTLACPGVSRPPANHSKHPRKRSSPLVLNDQSSGWRPPTTPSRQLARISQRNEGHNPPRRMGREDNCFASGSASLETPLRRAFAVSQIPLSCAVQYVADWLEAWCASNGSLWDWHFATAASKRTENQGLLGTLSKVGAPSQCVLPSSWRLTLF